MLACWQQEHTYHLHVASFFNLIICVVEIIYRIISVLIIE